MYKRYIKRILDIILSTIALVILSPLLFVTCVLIRIEDGGPAIFKQMRIGRDSRLFKLFKFRSMPVNVGDVPSSQAQRLRITRVGNIIRRANIDELPQLLNIIKGDMSIVGPRPALPSQTELLAIRVKNGACNCRPGLTGLAQINSYDGMSEIEKASFDQKYASCITFTGDFIIILKTFFYLLKRPPVY